MRHAAEKSLELIGNMSPAYSPPAFLRFLTNAACRTVANLSELSPEQIEQMRADLIAALQASPYRDIDIEPEERAMTLFGEDYYAATILDIVLRHCRSDEGLDSRGDRLRAELMMLCEEGGDIEIIDQFGWLITARLTPEGLETLAALAEQEAEEFRARQDAPPITRPPTIPKDKLTAADIEPQAGMRDSDEP
jgi:hypothetical protein